MEDVVVEEHSRALVETDAKLFARFKRASPTSAVWKECVTETGGMMMLAKAK